MQVLGDAQKRDIYDQYGEEGLKGVPPPGAGGPSFSNGDGGPTMFRFNPRNAEDIFSEFFGGSNPFGGMGMGGFSSSGMGGRGGGRNLFGESIFGNFGGGGGTESIFRSFGADQGGGGSSGGSRKAPPLENKLPCTLEELYLGSTRKMKISRNIADPSGYVYVWHRSLYVYDTYFYAIHLYCINGEYVSKHFQLSSFQSMFRV